MKRVYQILAQHRKSIAIGLTLVATWSLLQNDTVDNAIGLFVVSGVVPGTQIILGPDVIMQIVVGIFAAAIAGFVVWAVMRAKMKRLHKAVVQPQPASQVLVEANPTEERTIWERPARPVRLPRAALPKLITPRAAPHTNGVRHIAHMMMAKIAVASTDLRLFARNATSSLLSHDALVRAVALTRAAGRQLSSIISRAFRVAMAWLIGMSRIVSRRVWHYMQVVFRTSMRLTQEAWRVSEPKIRQFDAYVERHVKRMHRWLRIKAAHNETVSFAMQLYCHFLKRGSSKAVSSAATSNAHNNTTPEKA